MTISSRLQSFYSCDSSPFVLVLRMLDIRWLTGFTGSTARLLIDRRTQSSYLIVDGRYIERAEQELAHAHSPTHIVLLNSGDTMVNVLSQRINGEIALDYNHITAAQLRELTDAFHVVEESGHLDRLRRVKDNEEIELMAQAASIADKALQHVVSEGLLGETEKQIRNRLDAAMRQFGADTVSFDTIVATGANGARPHHEPSDTVVEMGHGVVIDMGAEVKGTLSDMTRTIRVGEWSAEYAQMFAFVREAQSAGLASVRAGVQGSDVDAAVREVYRRENVEHEYVHGTGHGVGLYIHEEPILSPRCTAVLSEGEVVTVEPGLYRKGVGGVRIEDQVVVTGSQCRILTLSPKELSCPRSQRTT